MNDKPEWLGGLNVGPLTRKPNFMFIPVNEVGMDEEGMRRFNDISKAVQSYGWPQIERTASGGIAKGGPRPSYDIRRTNYVVELTALTPWGNFRLQFKSSAGDERMRGRKAFRAFRRELLEDGIDLDAYAISEEEGKLQKEMIEAPPVGLAMPYIADQTWRKVNHIDFRSSFPAGLAERVPAFRPTIERLFRKKQQGSDMAKAILNMSIGFMQSISGCGARWAHLSRMAIDTSNERVYGMAQELALHGRTPLCYNTDGIWYAGAIYHGEGEGDGLGQWHNDHVNCTWRAKSGGAYEYIEDGEYHAVVRGVPNERKIDWKWGAIYTLDAEAITYKYDKEAKEIKKCQTELSKNT